MTSTSGSSRSVAKSVVNTPSAAGKERSLAGSRTSARTTRNRCPVARSISSPLSASILLTEAPTVPYPRSPTPTSTDAMGLRAEEPLDPRKVAELLADALDLGRALRAVLAQLREARPPGCIVREQLLREAAA